MENEIITTYNDNSENDLTNLHKKFFLNKKLFTIIIISVVLLIGIIATPIIVNNNTLVGDEKIAYYLVSEGSSSFKNPSSVRILSGKVFYAPNNTYICEYWGTFKIQATNSFGGVVTEYYGFLFSKTRGVSVSKATATSDIESCNLITFNVKKVNRALAKKWNS